MSKIMVSTAGAIALAVGLALPTITLAQSNLADPPVYGGQLMTEQERLEYREQMREAQTVEEREQLRSEHVERMQERARDQGVTLPANRPGAGMDPQGDAERNRRMMPGDRMQPRDGQGQGQGLGQGEGMEERYREEHQEQRREHMMENDDYRGGSGMGGGGRN